MCNPQYQDNMQQGVFKSSLQNSMTAIQPTLHKSTLQLSAQLKRSVKNYCSKLKGMMLFAIIFVEA